jgi:hypothetical protein
LAVLAGINIEFDPALLNQKAADGTPIPPPKANEKWKDVTARQALQALLDNYGLEMTQIPGNPILRVAPTDAHSAAPVMTKVNLVGKAPANGGATEEPTNTSKGDDVINVTIDDLPLPNAIRNLAVLAGINIEFDPALLNQKAADGTPIPPPKANEKWTDVTPKQALQKLLDEYGWEITRNPAYPILRIVAKK